MAPSGFVALLSRFSDGLIFRSVKVIATPLSLMAGSAETLPVSVIFWPICASINCVSTASGATRQLAKIIPAVKARIIVIRLVRRMAIIRRAHARARQAKPEKGG